MIWAWDRIYQLVSSMGNRGAVGVWGVGGGVLGGGGGGDGGILRMQMF